MPDPLAPLPGADPGADGRPFQARVDPPLADAFAKDPDDERFLERLDAALAPAEEAAYRDLDERYPTLHVIGAPRSGTTLLYQVLASALDVGYVDNLTAAFWRAPVTGLRLGRKLGVEPASSFGSEFGRTQGVAEPHEFGYFWNHHLAYPDLTERGPEHEAAIDWAGLRRVIVNMAAARRAPMVFKPMLLIWHLEAMVRAMPRTCYVWIRREPADTAMSLLRMRARLRGDVAEWASLRPRADLDGADPEVQVATQVLLLERTIERAALRLGPETVLAVRYEELCADPGGVAGRARDLMGAKGFAPAVRLRDIAPFVPGPDRGMEEHRERVDAAIDRVRATLGGCVA